MNVHDLSRDDDFLSHLLVEKLGTGTVPLVVHKMDSSAKLPKTDTNELMRLVRRLVITKLPLQQGLRQAVDELVTFPAIRYYLKSYNQKQINAFATHASRYFELYHPSGSIEIAHTSRYSSQTGKSELCVLATRPLAPGTVITELKGSMANLTDEEDKELKRAHVVNSDIRRDFSVIHSKSMKKNHLFLGPARFVNHDCDNNCELFREGRYITFRVLRPIAIGEEITAHYGDGYFGKKNRHCLCETCEKNGRGGYAPLDDDDVSSSSSSDSDSDSESSSSSEAESEEEKPVLNLNERRTRRGVYAITATKDDDSDDSENEEDNTVPLVGTKDIPIEVDIDNASELTSLPTSNPPSDINSPARSTPSILTPLQSSSISRSSSSLTSLSSSSEDLKLSEPDILSASSNPTRSQSKGSASRATTSQPTPTPTPSLRRSTRTSSSHLASISRSASASAKDRANATPGTSTGRSRNTPRTEVSVKKEDVDQRVLRARPSMPNVAEAAKEVASKEPPKGADGKALPTCSTCSNVLPVILVDSKVVWGGPESKKNKKKKQDCPRCIRHFAIYQQTWPSRNPPAGAFSIVPRAASPADYASKSSKKVLKYLQKQAEVTSSKSPSGSLRHQQKKRVREETVEESPRPAKKVKVDQPATVKLKQTPATPVKQSKAPQSQSSSPDDTPRRKRGRPRLSSPARQDPKSNAWSDGVVVKVEDAEVTEIPPKRLFSQPRALNGRFGKKDKGQRRSGDGSGSSGSPRSPRVKRERDNEADSSPWTSPRRKRAYDDDEIQILDPSPRKRQVVSRMDGNATKLRQRVMPRPTSTFRGPKLVSNPSPLNFALHAWAGPVILDDSSEDEDSNTSPETPEELQSPGPEIAEGDELSASSLLPLAAPVPRAPLIYKPTPFTFSKRRWVSLSQLPERLASTETVLSKGTEDEDVEEISEPHSMRRERTNSMNAQSYSPRWSKSFLTINPDVS
ncbi:hypothetical protein FA15DRAFT_594777 [Coprinopsis marcescibilis]|uniref:SET domain-containing protein n=1 Tax=Coprinopsis marcescibilis TaxID=230819 RepID=A0A5C3KRR5_COPMA|nr:hypothetical protein FA15DRAFT_594777 [Coprinopsis marcescibilis]